MRKLGWILASLAAVPAAALVTADLAEGDGLNLFGAASENRAPRFSSASAVNVPENSQGAVYMARASDPDGDRLSLTVAGGPDAARLVIDDSGALRFAQPPNFETPADADGDNIYNVVLAANDGDAVTRFGLRLAVTNAGQDDFSVRRVASGLVEPLFVAPVPDGSGRVYVVQKGGVIRILDPGTGGFAPKPFLDVSADISADGEGGLLGLALAPDFATSRVFYVYVTNLDGDSEIRRYRARGNNPDRADPDSGDVILTFDQPNFSNHKGGWLAFSPVDGFLYLATGDGGGSGDPNNTARNLNLLLGKIVRVDPTSDDFPDDPLRDYAIPADNPFAGGGGLPEIWALGLRNPYRCSFDRETGRLYIADVGQDRREEINLMRPTRDAGANFGWSIFEGTLRFKPGSAAGLIPPVLEYKAGSGQREGNSITGGYVYRGPVESLQGLYVYGDFINGTIWTTPASQFDIGQTLDKAAMTVRNDFNPDVGTIDLITSFGEDEAGNLYIVGIDGEVFVVEAA